MQYLLLGIIYYFSMLIYMKFKLHKWYVLPQLICVVLLVTFSLISKSLFDVHFSFDTKLISITLAAFTFTVGLNIGASIKKIRNYSVIANNCL